MVIHIGKELQSNKSRMSKLENRYATLRNELKRKRGKRSVNQKRKNEKLRYLRKKNNLMKRMQAEKMSQKRKLKKAVKRVEKLEKKCTEAANEITVDIQDGKKIQ